MFDARSPESPEISVGIREIPQRPADAPQHVDRGRLGGQFLGRERRQESGRECGHGRCGIASWQRSAYGQQWARR
jgi:hypothetical protein